MIQRMREPLSLRLVVVSGFALLALVHGVVLALVAAAREQPLLPASLVGVANAAVWLAITPLVVWCTRAVRDRHAGTLARVAIHVVGAAALAVPTGIVHATLAAASGIRPAIPLPAGVLYHFDLNIAIYVCIVLITHALDRSAAVILVRRRVLALERSLSDARVDFLTRQLRPHMLFNCLNAIAQLAIEAPVAAARMLSELGNFIAASQFARRGTLPLRDEIAITERYLALEQVRFADRLQTHIDVEPAALEARVPPLIL